MKPGWHPGKGSQKTWSPRLVPTSTRSLPARSPSHRKSRRWAPFCLRWVNASLTPALAAEAGLLGVLTSPFPCRIRMSGIKGLQGVVRKTVNDELQANIWDPQHMDKIVPSLLFNLQHGEEAER